MLVGILSETVKDAEAHLCLSNIQLATMCLLAFFGFLWFDKLIQLWLSDITITDEMMAVKIQRSKTDQLKQGDEPAKGYDVDNVMQNELLELPKPSLRIAKLLHIASV